MKKVLFMFLLLAITSTRVFAQTNVFCENLDSSSSQCMSSASVMYLGSVDGYTEAIIRHKKNVGEEINKEDIIREFSENIMSFADFYDIFKECGEASTDLGKAQACFMTNVQKLMYKKKNLISK